jgi:hypothetical protein
VASWKAPVIPVEGRRFTIQELLEAQTGGSVVRAALNGKEGRSTGQKGVKFVAPPGPHLAPEVGGTGEDVKSAPVPPSKGRVMTEAEEKKAVEKRQGCCANALWFD